MNIIKTFVGWFRRWQEERKLDKLIKEALKSNEGKERMAQYYSSKQVEIAESSKGAMMSKPDSSIADPREVELVRTLVSDSPIITGVTFVLLICVVIPLLIAALPLWVIGKGFQWLFRRRLADLETNNS